MSKFCLVTSEIVGPFKNGGIGTHCYYLVQYLASKPEIDVTIVYNGEIKINDCQYWKEKFRLEFKADFVWIHPAFTGEPSSLNSASYWDAISRANLGYLRSHHFDVILFQEMLGGGFRAIQAKKNLHLFASSLLVVMVHSSWQWINESMKLFPAYGLAEMLTKYMERYSVQHCDALVSPSQYMLNWTLGDVKDLPSFQRVLPYLFDPELPASGHDKCVKELIFFGRLEQRKGLLLFLESIKALSHEFVGEVQSNPIPVYFLGKPGRTIDGDGAQSISRFAPLVAPCFDLHIIDDLGHHEALEFLRRHPAALVVCPSLQDNSPFAIIENLLLGTNLISCRTGGIPELFADLNRLAQPTVTDLTRLIRDGITGRLPPVNSRYTVEIARNDWDKFLSLAFSSASSGSPNGGQPKPVPRRCYDGVLGHIQVPDLEHGSARLPAFCEAVALLEDDRLHAMKTDGTACSLLTSHWIVLGPECQIEPDFESSVRRAIASDQDCVWSCFVGFSSGEAPIHAPFGACLEAALAANVLGTGVAVLPGRVVAELTEQGLRLLADALLDPSSLWPFLAHIALHGSSLDVIPERLASMAGAPLILENGSSSYPYQASVIADMSSELPDWLQRLLPYTLELSPTIAADAASSASPLGGIPSVRVALKHHLRKLKSRYTKL